MEEVDEPGHIDAGNCSKELRSFDEPRSLAHQVEVVWVASLCAGRVGSNDRRSEPGTYIDTGCAVPIDKVSAYSSPKNKNYIHVNGTVSTNGSGILFQSKKLISNNV